MKTWIISLTGAVVLSFVHLLLELWRGFLDFAYVLPDYSNGRTSNMALYGLLYTVIFAIWLIGLRNAGQGKRGGIITAIVLGVLFWLGLDMSTIFFYCPGGCEEAVFDYSTYTSLVVGGLALYGLFVNLRQKNG